MKIIITESQLNSAYWMYLKYLLGELTEVHSDEYPSYRLWKNDKNDLVLKLTPSDSLYVHHEIWNSLKDFFDLNYTETKGIMKSLLEEHLKLKEITPRIGKFTFE
jgi:hypothetical protein